MRVRMTRTERGSPDGTHVNTYLNGQEYEMPPDLAGVFIGLGWAVAAVLPPIETPKHEADSVNGKAESGQGGVTLPPDASDAPQGQIDVVATKAKKGRKR